MTEKTWDNLRWVQLSEADESCILEMARLRNQAVTEGNISDEQYYADALAVLVIETFGGGK